MGMYSEVINACPRLGPEFLGVLQTKELTSLMDAYWLAPDGCLYQIWHEYSEGEEKPRGYVRPYRKSGVIRFTAASGKGYLEALTHFKCGQLSAVLCVGPIFSCETVPA